MSMGRIRRTMADLFDGMPATHKARRRMPRTTRYAKRQMHKEWRRQARREIQHQAEQ